MKIWLGIRKAEAKEYEYLSLRTWDKSNDKEEEELQQIITKLNNLAFTDTAFNVSIESS